MIITKTNPIKISMEINNNSSIKSNNNKELTIPIITTIIIITIIITIIPHRRLSKIKITMIITIKMITSSNIRTKINNKTTIKDNKNKVTGTTYLNSSKNNFKEINNKQRNQNK